MDQKAIVIVVVDQAPNGLHPVPIGKERRDVADAEGSTRIGDSNSGSPSSTGLTEFIAPPRRAGLEDVSAARRRRSRYRHRDTRQG